MARWEPNARERLEQAAMELFRERGFDETAAADIAARAGLTERTFFRHFTDKREVLFGGASALQDFLVAQLAAMPSAIGPMDAVVTALEATAPMFEERRARAKVRQSIIMANAALQERELIKLVTLGSALAAALRARGVSGSAAALAAEMGIAVFKLAFERWVNESERDLAQHVRETRAELEAVVAGAGRTAALIEKSAKAM